MICLNLLNFNFQGNLFNFDGFASSLLQSPKIIRSLINFLTK
jgi:hypothetical protein